ncbi:MAG: hypothetical protein Q9169_007557 [Polycauliona sp. 2 TL-2023]
MNIMLGSTNALEDLMLDVQALEDDPAAGWVSARPHDPNVDRPEAIQSAKRWVTECLDYHHQCSIRNTWVDDAKTSPKRLLKIYDSNTGKKMVKLHLCEQHDHPKYAALSYCWGIGQDCKLTLSNLETMFIDVPLSSLAQTIQDAISVACRMGVQFIWIDSLCIIQDSNSDKADEISAMDHIYQNAEFTICAASAVTCAQGFLQERTFDGLAMPEQNHSTLEFPCPNGAR